MVTRNWALVSCNERGFFVVTCYKDAKNNIFSSNSGKDIYICKESDLRCPARSRRKLFVVVSSKYMEMVPLLSPAINRKEKLREKVLLLALLFLTQVWIYVYFLVVLQLCFDFEARSACG